MELWLSIAALAAGPLLFPVAKRHPRLLCGMDGLVLVAIAGLSLGHLLPIAVAHAGRWSLLTMAAGVVGPFVFGRSLPHADQRHVHNAFILFAVVGLAIHAAIDGAALFEGTHHTGPNMHLGGMVAAVLIHRLPMSLLVWWSLRPALGRWVAACALGGLAAATGLGYVLGGAVAITPTLMGHLVAFVAGSLLHVVAHDTASELIPRSCHDKWHATYSAVGGAVAAAALISFGHLGQFKSTWQQTWALCLELAPFVLAGWIAITIAWSTGSSSPDPSSQADPDGAASPTSVLLSRRWLAPIDRLSVWLGVAAGLIFVVLAAAPGLAGLLMGEPMASTHPWWQWAAAGVLGALFMISYFRMGPRNMLLHLFPDGYRHSHNHHHRP